MAASRGRFGPVPSAKSLFSALSICARVIPSIWFIRGCSPKRPPRRGCRNGRPSSPAEAVDLQRPLQTYHRALDRLEENDGQEKRQRAPDRHVSPHRQIERGLHDHEFRHHEMAHDDDDDVGRQMSAR